MGGFWFYQPRFLILLLQQLLADIIFSVKTTRPLFAITFDDGPSSSTSQIVDILGQYNASGTFFFIGTKAKLHPKILPKLKASGHQICNHFYDSQLTLFLNDKQIVKSLQKADQIIKQNRHNKFIRPSGSIFRPSLTRLVKMFGFTVVLGSAYTMDWLKPPKWYMRWALGRMLKPGAIVILHESTRNLQTLQFLLDEGNKKGLRAVTLTKLVSAKTS